MKSGGVEGEPGQRGENQRIARQFARQPGFAMARQHADRQQVGHRHHRADQDAHRRHALGTMQLGRHRQPDVRVVAKRALKLRGEGQRRLAEQRPRGEPEQCTGEQHREPGADQRRGGGEVDAGARQGTEQQRREQHDVDQLLQPAPEMIAQMQQPAQQRTEQDQREVGQQKEGGSHASIGSVVSARATVPGEEIQHLGRRAEDRIGQRSIYGATMLRDTGPGAEPFSASGWKDPWTLASSGHEPLWRPGEFRPVLPQQASSAAP